MVAPQAAGGLPLGLLQGHAALDALEVHLPRSGLPLCGAHSAPGRKVRQVRRGDLHFRLDGVAVAQIFVDVGGSHLACRNGPDDRGGAGDAVTAREHSLHVRQMGAAVRQDRTAPLDLNTGLLEAVGLNALADGHDDDIRRDPELWLIRAVGTGAAVFVRLPNNLGLSPEGGHMAVRPALHPHRSLEGQQLRTLRHGALHFLRQGGHVLLPAAVDAGHLICT